MPRQISCLLAALALVLPSTGSAQQPIQNDLVDRVVAVVGDSTVLQTQILYETQQLQLADSTLPGPAEPGYNQLLNEVLQGSIDRLLMVQAAQKDTLIQVDDAAIDQSVSTMIDQLARQFGGQAQLQQALRSELQISLAEYRELRRTEMRQRQIVELFLQSRMRNARPVEVTEAEMRERFQQLSPQLMERPRSLSFRQVVLRPEPSDSAKAAALEEAEALFARAQAGEDFAALARQYSDDTGTAPLGGDLGWFRRGQMVDEFEDAAFALAQGRMGMVESVFGYHVIKVERRRGRSEVQARHILIIPDVSEEAVAAARDEARQVLARARAGEDMEALYDAYSQPTEPDSMTVAFQQLGNLPPSYSALANAEEGEVVGPLEFQNGSAATRDLRLAIVKVTEIREAGAWTFEDYRAQIAQMLDQEKKRQRILDGLREQTYIDIRM